ncbi:helix-turn-helix domain-containing protein [Variovorax sp. LjRoot175]|uniref:AraC-like ligand-binding domain-containing protein n=1 Tax=Variovorax sp. LjRoot175 TaxID=3342276 RepID=UPI003ED0152F
MPMIWDTCDVSARDRFAYWRDCVTQAYLPLEPEAPSRAAFHGRIVRNGGERLKVSRVVSAGSLVFRTAPGIAKRQNGSFFANLILSGEAGVKQGGRSGRARAGEVMVVDTNQPFELSFEMGVDVICIAFDGTTLRRLEERAKESASLVIGPAGAGALVAGYISGLAADLDQVHLIAELAADQFPALMTRACLPAVSCTSSLATLAARINQLIDAEIDNPDLGAKRIASVVGVSRTMVYEAMAELGQTLAGSIRECRLRGCMADLAASDPKRTSISEISARWGFRDAAAFSRTFKRINGLTPAEFRRRYAAILTS